MKAQIINERKKLLVSIERLLEGPMIFLGFVWLVLLIVELIWGLSKPLDYLSLSIWVIFIASFTPIPYKVFTVTAGLLHMALLPFILTSLIGRGMRFFLVAGLMRWVSLAALVVAAVSGGPILLGYVWQGPPGSLALYQKNMFYRNVDSDYRILGITEQATDEEVKKAYRKMAISFHPDKVAQMGEEYQKGAKEKFQRIQDAYEAIKKRRGFK